MPLDKGSWVYRNVRQAPSSVSTRETGGTGRDRTYLRCGCVVTHRRQLDILNLNVTALERRPVYSCSSRV